MFSLFNVYVMKCYKVRTSITWAFQYYLLEGWVGGSNLVTFQRALQVTMI